jgi:hypothetical protein
VADIIMEMVWTNGKSEGKKTRHIFGNCSVSSRLTHQYCDRQINQQGDDGIRALALSIKY